MRALILCAGLGERLRPLTLKRAKPAIEFLNMPMLAFPYYWLDTIDLSALVLNTHHLPDTIRHAAMQVVNPNCQLHLNHEEAILGSGGGIDNARFHLQWDRNFAVANGDGVVTFKRPDTIEQMLRFHERQNALATLLVCPLEGVGSQIPGVWMDKFAEVTNFGKTPRRDYLECFHYASFAFFSQRLWNYLPEGPSNILYDVLEPAIAQGEKVFGYRVGDMRWFETGNAADYLSSTERCLEFLKSGDDLGAPLKQMLDRFAPGYRERSNFAERRLIAPSSEVAGSAQLRGFTVIGADAQVGAEAKLENCVVLPGGQVTPAENFNRQIII